MGHQGHKTGGRKAGRPNNRTIEQHEAAAETVALVGELIPDAFAGDAHAFLVPRTVTRSTPSLCQGPLHVTESALETVTRNEAFPGRSHFRLMPDRGGCPRVLLQTTDTNKRVDFRYV